MLVSQGGTYQVHPALLDACLQVCEAAFPGYGQHPLQEDTYLPISWERVKIYHRPGTYLWSHACMRPRDGLHQEIRIVDLHLFDAMGQTLLDVEGLHFKRATRDMLLRSATQEHLNGWLYQVAWQPKAPLDLEPHQPDLRGSWLIFADRGGVGTALARLLEQRGETCIIAFQGESYAVEERGHFRINPASSEDFRQLFEECIRASELPYRGIVHLWSLEAMPSTTVTTSALHAAQALICGSVLHLVHVLATVYPGTTFHTNLMRLCLVTRGAQAVASEPGPLAVIQSPLWGLGKVIMREHPELRCAIVDLDPTGEEDEVQALCTELVSSDRESLVALRGDVRWVSRLLRSAANVSQAEGELQVPEHQPYTLEITQPGVLEKLSFRSTKRRIPGPGEVEIQVHVTGLNFRDVLNALGRLSGTLGVECIPHMVRD
jgi:polyketide synthase 12/epothilone polyketide synthase D